MPHIIDVDSLSLTPGAYTNAWGTQCVALVQMATPAAGSSNPGPTHGWTWGTQVRTAAPGVILRGTVIATFTDVGRYPSASEGNRHAAVYISHDANGITVIDQWHPGKPTPGQRVLTYAGEDSPRQVNRGDHYYVVEPEA